MKHIVTINLKCKIKANEAWDQIRDFSTPHKYISFIQNTIVLGQTSGGVGSTRRVFTRYNYMDETVTNWEEGSSFTVKLHKNKQAPFPFSAATFRYQIRSINKKDCELIGIFTYELLFGIIGIILNHLFLGIIIRFNIRRVIMGLKMYLNQSIII